MRSFRSKPVGWRGESYRHYLAAKGIKTYFYGRSHGKPSPFRDIYGENPKKNEKFDPEIEQLTKMLLKENPDEEVAKMRLVDEEKRKKVVDEWNALSEEERKSHLDALSERNRHMEARNNFSRTGRVRVPEKEDEQYSEESIPHEIARDYLEEDPEYYKKLEKFEQWQKEKELGLEPLGRVAEEEEQRMSAAKGVRTR